MVSEVEYDKRPIKIQLSMQKHIKKFSFRL